MLDQVVFVRPTSSEQELCSLKAEPEPAVSTSLSGEEAQAFYDDLLGLPSTSYPKPDFNEPVSHKPHRDSSDDEGDEALIVKSQPQFTKNIFSHAQNGEHRELRRILLLKKVDVNMQDAYGWSPLHCAAFEGHLGCIKILLKFGASKDLKDNRGRTPLELARKSKNHSAYHLIKHYGENEERLCPADCPKPEIVTCQTCDTEFDANKRDQHLSSIVHRAAAAVVKEPSYVISEGNIGFRMLESMGWKKEKGLGPEGNGRKFPVKTELKRNRKGLGLSDLKARVSHFDPKDVRAVKYENEVHGEKLKKRVHKKAIKEKTLEKAFRRAFY